MITNSTVNLREGELLVLQCNTTTDIYQYLELAGCTPPPGLPGPAPNTTGYCAIPGNYTSIVVHGFLKNSNMDNSVNLLEFDVEIHNLEQCLALADAQETPPSPCTTPPPIDDPTTSMSTSSTTSTNADTTDPGDSHDPTETADPEINNPAGIKQNDTTNIEIEEIKDYTLYTAVCVLGVIALVQTSVIVLLAVKLCCRKGGVKMAENGEIHPEKKQEMKKMSQQSSTSDKHKASVIINSDVETSMDISRENGGGGAISTDQRQELEVMGKTTSDKDKEVQVIANGSSEHIDVETTTNASKGATAVTKKQGEEEEVEIIANGGTCTMEAKERERTHGSSTDSTNLTHATINL